ncbi:MAG: phenylalanine--tRNA ligase subunit beta [Candidatus Omnitrophica bacterium]|nr:phenylalanine--tRNA ligase subunit beta [Candidatus Omnitrophota bacterium]MDD5661562.1 phenylalanine--tRNA ligase subunit beta [Candidatus Omnitrophota bacterium]
MKVTYNWLKEFVDIKIPAKQLADKLTMAGLEVVSLEEKAGDFVLEIEITSNRPDWLSVLGVAREVAAITRRELKAKNPKPKTKTAKGNLRIEIEDKRDCLCYTARIIRGIKVGPSPEWLRKRLELVGCRSVNNIVDITNYALLELGEPLHAFDLDKLNPGKIVVRRAKAGEKIATLDGQVRSLNNNVLVIADKAKAVAIAGVMGGKETEVTLDTRNILLEAAVFNPIVVRRCRQALGLQSESSYRFERGVDLGMVEQASLRAAQLIREYCFTQEVSFNSSGLVKCKEGSVKLGMARATEVLGANIAPAKIKQTLSRLGFAVKQKAKNILDVGVPSSRPDVKLEVDLIEELARIFGYERIPVSLPAVKPRVTANVKRALTSTVKEILVGLGLSEVITYSLTDKLTLNSLGLGVQPIEILNPLSQEQEVLRPTLISGLGRAVSLNFNQKQEYVAIFEISNIFLGENKPREELTLGIALSGTKSFLLEQGRVKDEASFLNLKGIVETIFARLGIRDYVLHNQGSSAEIRIQDEKVGQMLSLSSQSLDRLNIKNKNVFMLELSLDKVSAFTRRDKKFIPLPRYPGIARDISFILKEGFSVQAIMVLLKEKGRPLLSEVRITDYYKGRQIPVGYRGLTLSCFYSSNERTLAENEIQPTHELLCAELVRQFGVKLR